MAQFLSNFLEWFFPSVSSLPVPFQVLLGTVFLGIFFGLLLRIFGGLR